MATASVVTINPIAGVKVLALVSAVIWGTVTFVRTVNVCITNSIILTGLQLAGVGSLASLASGVRLAHTIERIIDRDTCSIVKAWIDFTCIFVLTPVSMVIVKTATQEFSV